MRDNGVLVFLSSSILVWPVFGHFRNCITGVSFYTVGVPGQYRQLVIQCEGLTTRSLLHRYDKGAMYLQKRTPSGPITIATMGRRKSTSVNDKVFISGVYPIKMEVFIPSPTCDDVTTYVCNINTSYSHCQGKKIQVKMDDCGSKSVDILPDEDDEKDGQSSGLSLLSTSRPQSDDLTAEKSPSGVPVYVVVIACVTSALLTAALYTAVVVGWTKGKCQTQTVTLTNTETEGNYETTTRDVNMEENAYCSLTPVQTAYLNININNQTTLSTSSATQASPSSNTNNYYSVVEDSIV